MTMKIDSQLVDSGPSIYYDPAFRNVLEDHLTYLRTHEKTQLIAVDVMQAYRFEGDLNGLLSYYRVPVYLQWLVMRMNKFTSPLDASKDLISLIVPDYTTVEQIRQSHMTVRRIS